MLGLNHWAKANSATTGSDTGSGMTCSHPVETPDGKLSYDPKLREQAMKDPKTGYLVYPEISRNTILFGGTDPAGSARPT